MLDPYGRVICKECGSYMKAVDVAYGEALFQCQGCSETIIVLTAFRPRQKAAPKAA